MRRNFKLTILMVLIGCPAWAQFNQYVQPGSLAEDQMPMKDRLEAAMEQARWKLGPVKLAPWFAFKDFSYINNVDGSTGSNQISDYTATAGAGLHGYLARGKKVVFAVHALPEYVWWKELANRRLLNYKTGAGFFGYFNRLTVEATAQKARQQMYVSSEYERPVNTTRDVAELNAALRLSGRLSLFAKTSQTQLRYRQEDVPVDFPHKLTLLDRDEAMARAGLRYAPSERSSISVGYFWLDTAFRRDLDNRSNQGQGIATDVELVRGDWSTTMTLVALKLEPKSGSRFTELDKRVLGRAGVAWNVTEKTSVHVYGARNLVYSSVTTNPYYFDERAGVAFDFALGWRTRLRVFAEKAWSSYASTAQGGVTYASRVYGASGAIEVAKGLHFAVNATYYSYANQLSTLGEDSVLRVQASLQLSSKGGGWW